MWGPNDWYAEAVNYAVSNGLFLGISETEFGPNVSMSRAMLVTVLHRMAGAPNAGAANFADVPADAWYTQAVAWAAANGIVQGVSDSRFAPNVPVTREQMATILYRYANHAGVAGDGGSGSLDGFRDASAVSGYAVQAMGWAVRPGPDFRCGRSEIVSRRFRHSCAGCRDFAAVRRKYPIITVQNAVPSQWLRTAF